MFAGGQGDESVTVYLFSYRLSISKEQRATVEAGGMSYFEDTGELSFWPVLV